MIKMQGDIFIPLLSEQEKRSKIMNGVFVFQDGRQKERPREQ